LEKGHFNPLGEGNLKTLEDYQKEVECEIGVIIGEWDIDSTVVDMEKFDW